MLEYSHVFAQYFVFAYPGSIVLTLAPVWISVSLAIFGLSRFGRARLMSASRISVVTIFACAIPYALVVKINSAEQVALAFMWCALAPFVSCAAMVSVLTLKHKQPDMKCYQNSYYPPAIAILIVLAIVFRMLS
jgi:hypothetical protein